MIRATASSHKVCRRVGVREGAAFVPAPSDGSLMVQERHVSAAVEFNSFEYLLGPSNDQLVDVRGAFFGGPDRPGVGNDHPETELPTHHRQWLADVTGAEQKQHLGLAFGRPAVVDL